MKTWMKYTLTLLIIAILGGVFYKKIYIPKTTFKTINPTLGDLNVSVRGIGNLGALHIYNITAQTGGKILKIYADNGNWVKKGELLIVMDGVDLPEQLEVLKANLKKARFEVKASKDELKNQKAQKILLQITYDRYNRLNKKGFATKAEYDKAKADLQSINAQILASKAQINASKATQQGALKSIKALQTKINRLKIYSPINGYVVSREAEVAQSVLPTKTILKIVDPKTLWITAKIDERVSSQIKLTQKATITLRSQANKKYDAYVKRIEPTSDAVTLERDVEVAFRKVPKPFYINEQALVNIDVKSYKNILKVPLNVIVQKEGNIGIWILKNGHPIFKKVEKIGQNNSEMAISNINKNIKIIIPNKTH